MKVVELIEKLQEFVDTNKDISFEDVEVFFDDYKRFYEIDRVLFISNGYISFVVLD